MDSEDKFLSRVFRPRQNKIPRPKPCSEAEEILARLVASYPCLAQGDVNGLAEEVAEWIANELFAVDSVHLKRLLKDRAANGTPIGSEA